MVWLPYAYPQTQACVHKRLKRVQAQRKPLHHAAMLCGGSCVPLRLAVRAAGSCVPLRLAVRAAGSCTWRPKSSEGSSHYGLLCSALKPSAREAALSDPIFLRSRTSCLTHDCLTSTMMHLFSKARVSAS